MGLVRYADDGFFAPRKIAEAFRTTSEEVARTAGLGKDAVQRKERVRSDRTQRRLREMVEIINKVEPRFGSAMMAYAWYRSGRCRAFRGSPPCSSCAAAALTTCSNTSMRSMPASTPDPIDALSRPALSRP